MKIQISKWKDEKQLPKQKAKSKYPGKSKNENIKKLFELDTKPETCDGQISQNCYDYQTKLSANLITSRTVLFSLMKTSNKHLWFKLLEPFLLPRLFLILKRGEDGIASFVTVL